MQKYNYIILNRDIVHSACSSTNDMALHVLYCARKL